MEYKISVDQKNKLVKIVWSGIPDAGVIAQATSEVLVKLDESKKEENLLLADTSGADARFLTPEVAKATNDLTLAVLPYCKKMGVVVPGFMLQKSFEAALPPNLKYFVAGQEAMKWLLEK